MTVREKRKLLGEKDFRAYYDASQFRTDAWNELKVAVAKLAKQQTPDSDKAEDLKHTVANTLEVLEELERYWAFPGRRTVKDLRTALKRSWSQALKLGVDRIARSLENDDYRRRNLRDIFREIGDHDTPQEAAQDSDDDMPREKRPYFELLVVDRLTPSEEDELRASLLAMRRDDDEFIYDVVVAPSCEDAIIAALFNHNIQCCVMQYGFDARTVVKTPELLSYLDQADPDLLKGLEDDGYLELAKVLKELRPEVNLFLVTDDPVENIVGRSEGLFDRMFYRTEDYLELHLSILKGIDSRYETPFFTALKEYSAKPTGVFHALPISRGKTITKSHWIKDMGDFYGRNIFLAETSATTGGLDSLLQPTGPLKEAQEKVARAYGSRHSYFVTNGTSTANKIVMQALCRPGDIVLVSHDCHKSHPYAILLSGALPVYLDPYPLPQFTMYGGVPLRRIKEALLNLKRAGKLDRVRLLLLTNCTFDGVVYDPLRIMREVLAIKPDMIFVWDEAWFAFARFMPTYRRRTGMWAAGRLRRLLKSPEYRAEYDAWKERFAASDPNEDSTWLDNDLMPDPDEARVRVYATQSTHKTLTSLRQGSAIHVYDQDFARKSEGAFEEAYMTHTSTSPNYQILASLDVGRRQVELEGYEFVKKAVELSMALRERIEENPQINRWFRLLRVQDIIPAQYRPSGLDRFYSPDSGFKRMEEAWREDEFALDPQRVTVEVGSAGVEGDAFRKLLMDRFDIQINKTSRNTVLFMLNIGTTRGAIAYLLEVLLKLAAEIDGESEERSPMEQQLFDGTVDRLTNQLPPLPLFSRFHQVFRPDPTGDTPEGDLRTAFFEAYDEDKCEYLKMDGTIARAMGDGREVVSASFVTPYPPGFPVLVPGQVISEGILSYLKALDVKEIHGYNPQFGLRVFRQSALDALQASHQPARVN